MKNGILQTQDAVFVLVRSNRRKAIIHTLSVGFADTSPIGRGKRRHQGTALRVAARSYKSYGSRPHSHSMERSMESRELPQSAFSSLLLR